MDRLAEDIERNLMIRGLSAPEVTVTDEEVRQFFDENADLFAQQEKVRARHILVDTGRGRGTAETTARRRRLRGVAARAHSKDPGSGPQAESSAGSAAALWWLRLSKPLSRSAVGEISEPVQSNFGYHLIKVEERVEAEERGSLTTKSRRAFTTRWSMKRCKRSWGRGCRRCASAPTWKFSSATKRPYRASR